MNHRDMFLRARTVYLKWLDKRGWTKEQMIEACNPVHDRRRRTSLNVGRVPQGKRDAANRRVLGVAMTRIIRSVAARAGRKKEKRK